MSRPVNEIALELGALKAMEDRVKELIKERKDELHAVIPRGTTYASIEGADRDGLATVTATADNAEDAPVVVDPEAFVDWVIQNRPSAIVATVRSSDQADILAQVAKTGEFVPGVEMRERVTKGSVAVKQSPKQKQQLLEAWANGRLQPLSSILQLEAEPDA